MYIGVYAQFKPIHQCAELQFESWQDLGIQQPVFEQIAI